MMLDRMEGNAELKTSVQQMLATRRLTHSVLLVGEAGLGTGFAALVGAQAAGKVIGPAGIQTAIRAAHHVDPGGSRVWLAVRRGAGAGTKLL